LAAVSVLLLQLAATSTETISQIRFEGNRRTRAETLEREMVVKPGDPADPEQIEVSRQAIMDLELFKSVRADLVPGPTGVDLVITVQEKRYFFVLPSLGRNADGDVTYGGQAQFDNLNGRNHRMEIEATRKELASGAPTEDERTAEFEYRYPRMAGGPWQLDTQFQYQRALVDEERDGVTGEFERDSARVVLIASRWRRYPGPSRGWYYGGGLSWQDSRYEFVRGDPTLFVDTTEAALLGRLGYRNVHNYEFNQAGRALELALDAYPQPLGAVEDRLYASVRYRAYVPVTRRRFTNVNYQLRTALVTHTIGDDSAFDLAGSSNVRGYPRGLVDGNAFFVGNVEFVTPISKLDALRGVVFADAGSILGDPDALTVLTAAGLGIRWKVRRFVRVDLRVDVARGFDNDHEGETKFYAGPDASF
jgi:outer membrane protein assembly factor BamA